MPLEPISAHGDVVHFRSLDCGTVTGTTHQRTASMDTVLLVRARCHRRWDSVGPPAALNSDGVAGVDGDHHAGQLARYRFAHAGQLFAGTRSAPTNSSNC